MTARTLEKLNWILIYGGLLGFGLGASMIQHEVAFGALVAGCGLVAALAGVVGIFVRSRRPNKD